MPCDTPQCDISDEEYYTSMLCQACDLLTKEQILSIKSISKHSLWCYPNLWGWYKDHLENDYRHYFLLKDEDGMIKVEKKANRLGCNVRKVQGIIIIEEAIV